jgi:hypothetical protein
MQKGSTSPDNMVDLASRPQDRQMDVCGQCHAGAGTELAPALSFKPGDVLSKYISIKSNSAGGRIDVHGNQIEPLESSLCWQKSANLTCTTCHNVHETQRHVESFSSFCLNCHKARSCGLYAKRGGTITQQCIGCRMPLQESEALVSDTQSKEIKPVSRNHQIAIYR